MENIIKWVIKIDNHENQRIRIQYNPTVNSEYVRVSGEYGIKNHSTTYYELVHADYHINSIVENLEGVISEIHQKLNENIEKFEKINNILSLVKNVDVVNDVDIIEKPEIKDVYGNLNEEFEDEEYPF